MEEIIKYIRYKYEGGFEIYQGQLQVTKFNISDIINAINHRLNNIPKRDVTLAYDKYCEDVCFLVRLLYDFDRLNQYFETTNDSLTLNFCDKHWASHYSITYYRNEDFSKKAIFEKSHLIKFSNEIKAPLKNLDELKKSSLPLYPFRLKFGKRLFNNDLYCIDNNDTFCLPLRELIEGMVKSGIIKNYIKSIEAKYDDITLTLFVKVICKREAHGDHYYENQYFGYINLETFDFIIQNQNEEMY